MNGHGQNTLDRLTDAARALDRAYEVTVDRDHLNRTRLPGAIGHLAEIARGLTLVLSSCATGARDLSEQTNDPTAAEAHHDTHQATSAALAAAGDVRRALVHAHAVAWDAHNASEPASNERSTTTGRDVRDLLDIAAGRLTDNAHHVTNPAALPAVVTLLLHITARLRNLTERCVNAAARLAERSTATTAATAHRNTQHALHKAVPLARTLRHRLHPVQTFAEQGHVTSRRSGNKPA
ncbi:hypothetical protein ACRAKI_09220 [Saccharothrix isguenensis]